MSHLEQNQLKEKIQTVLEENKVGTLSTVEKNKPHARYMTFFNEDFKLFTATSSDTHKTEEIETNPNVHILLGYDGEGFGDSYIEYQGTATVREDKETKKKIWNEHLKPWFDGPEDPKYVVLEIDPTRIRLMNNKGNPPETLKL